MAVCGSALAIGQAAIALCGIRRWSWLAPPVGLALLCAICWGTLRLPGDGTISASLVLLLTVAAVAGLWGRLEGAGEGLRSGLPVALLALAAALLPFLAAGHFGILGTGFNPDMSQHLLAADRLSNGEGTQLLHQGYPLGPHAIVIALGKGFGIDLVDGFSGLTIAVAVLASLTSLTAFAERRALLRTAAALAVGLTYMVASYFAQGAFKETMQALFFLAFVLALRESSFNPDWRQLQLRFVPAAVLAAGSVYTYSFAGLIWLIGATTIWAATEFAISQFRSSAGGANAGGPRTEAQPPPACPPAVATGPAAWRAALYGVLVFTVLIAPEIGRMIDFQSFETFDPNGPGLGNLFGPISPFEAFGIWPSGDFRLSPGDGAVPPLGYYLGAAFASILCVYGVVLCWRRRETALIAALAAAISAYAAARFAGTPYTAAKAVEVAAPLVALVILVPLLSRPVGLLFLLAAGGCSLLVLANAPVGPSSYTPALTGLREDLGAGPTVVLASQELLADEHGAPYIAWELRGGRVCIESDERAGGRLTPGTRFVVTEGTPSDPPFPRLRVRRIAPPYILWEQTSPLRGHSPCPLIAVRQTPLSSR